MKIIVLQTIIFKQINLLEIYLCYWQIREIISCIVMYVISWIMKI